MHKYCRVVQKTVTLNYPCNLHSRCICPSRSWCGAKLAHVYDIHHIGTIPTHSLVLMTCERCANSEFLLPTDETIPHFHISTFHTSPNCAVNLPGVSVRPSSDPPTRSSRPETKSEAPPRRSTRCRLTTPARSRAERSSTLRGTGVM